MNVKRQFNKAKATLQAALSNGAGLLMDQELRRFLAEFNRRLWNYGPDSMPASLNILRPFYRYDRELLMLRMEAERDHLFSFSDFIDFATSKDAPSDPFEVSRSYPAMTILSFNNLDDPHDITFATESGAEYGVGGISFICEGTELTVMLVGGRVADLASETEQLPSPENWQVHSNRWKIQPADGLKHEAAPLEGTQNMWKTLALARFDLKKNSEDVRYLLIDEGDSYSVKTDDPQILDEAFFGDPDLEKQHLEGLNEGQVLFQLCKTAFLLPSYFAFKITLVREEKRVTDFGREATFSSNQGTPGAGPANWQERVVYKTISALRILRSDQIRTVRRFTPPKFQVQVEGFWRRLSPDSIGKDSDNNPVVGRTWVKSHLRWRRQPARPIEVLVKSRVSIARAIAEAEAHVKSISTPENRATPVCSSPETSLVVDNSTNQPQSAVSREEAYRERAKLTTRLRWRILERDNFRCKICGADAASDPNVRLDVDHVIAVSNGGKTEPSNLRTLCNKCNNGKGHLVL